MLVFLIGVSLGIILGAALVITTGKIRKLTTWGTGVLKIDNNGCQLELKRAPNGFTKKFLLDVNVDSNLS